MAKRALSFFIKISLFAVVMVLVAIYIPYDGLTDYFTTFFDFQSADKVTRFILGEPDPEIWESLRSYFAILINTLISIPLLSAFITAYNVVTRRISTTGILKKWGTSTLRRFIKLFAFTFLFWAFFRTLPYQSFLPDHETYGAFAAIAVFLFNLLITIACYWFITQKIIIKRSL